VVGQLSPDILSVYLAPEMKARAVESLERYSEQLLEYEDLVKQRHDAAGNVEIDSSDGTLRDVTDLPPLPEPPRAPLFRSEHWIEELDEVLKETSDHFQSKNGGWKVHARAARFERLMDERYGRLRPILRQHPELETFLRNVQRKYATGYFSPFRQGRPPIPKSTAVIILFMMQRGNLRKEITVLAVLFFLVGLQPWALVVLVAGGHGLLENRRRRPIKPMKKHIPTTAPYYAVEVEDDEEVDEEREKQHKVDMLKKPVGTRLGADETIDTGVYDTILLGSGPSALYTGALLSRAGRKVLVLSSRDDASGCYTLESSGVPEASGGVPFDVESSNVSKCSRQQNLLAPALCSSTDYQGGIRFARIGSEADGYAFEILSVPGMGSEGGKDGVPFVVRAGGTQSLVEDAAMYLGDGWPGVTPGDYGNSASATYLGICEAMNATSNQFYISKLLDDSVNNMRSASTYQESTIRYASIFLDKGFPLNAHVRSLFAALGMKGENLKPSETSMGAHVTNVCSTLSEEGMHYPIGGPRAICHAFTSVIEESGGRVLTQVPFGRLIFEQTKEMEEKEKHVKEGETPSAPRCIGIQLADKREIKFDMAKWKNESFKPAVVSFLGMVTTFIRLLPAEIRDKYNIPRGLPALSERRPVIKILFQLRGNARQLDVTGADFYRLPAASLARDAIDPATGEVRLGEIGGSVVQSAENEVQVETVNQDTPDASGSGDATNKTGKVKYEAGSSWMQISFPSAKDPSFESRHGKITTCVVTIEADDDFVTPFQTKPKLFAIQKGKGKTHSDYQWLMERVQKDLLDTYPQLDGKIMHSTMVGPLYRGLSHNPQRFAAKGIRPESPYPGLFTGGADLTIGESFSGSIVGGWLAANAVVGYSAVDHLFLQKNITTDIIQYMELPDPPEEADLAVDFIPETMKLEDEQAKDASNQPPQLKKEQ
jgi:all-trans-retinol 13,14-reductase